MSTTNEFPLPSLSVKLLQALRTHGPMRTGEIRTAVNDPSLTSDVISSYLTMLSRRGYIEKEAIIDRSRAMSNVYAYRRFLWHAVDGVGDPSRGMRKPCAPPTAVPPEPEPPPPPGPRRTYRRQIGAETFTVVWDGTDATA